MKTEEAKPGEQDSQKAKQAELARALPVASKKDDTFRHG